MNKKTTIAISEDNRNKLQAVKILLEKKRQHFVDLDETVSYVLKDY